MFLLLFIRLGIVNIPEGHWPSAFVFIGCTLTFGFIKWVLGKLRGSDEAFSLEMDYLFGPASLAFLVAAVFYFTCS